MDEEEHVSSSEGLHRIKDHLLFNTLSFLVKVFKHCQVIKNPSRQQDMAQIWGKWSFSTECVESESRRPATRRVSDSYCPIRVFQNCDVSLSSGCVIAVLCQKYRAH